MVITAEAIQVTGDIDLIVIEKEPRKGLFFILAIPKKGYDDRYMLR
jgi:hypothetical protein